MPSPLRSSEQNAMRSGDGVDGAAQPGRPPVHRDGAGVGAVGAEEQPGQLRPPGPEQACQAEHLAGVHGDVGGGDRAGPAEPGRGQGRGVGEVGDVGRRLAVEVGQDGELVADHLGHHLQPGECGDRVLADELPVAQDRRAVGDRVDLVEEVGDEQHRDAARAQVADHPEELLHLVGVEAGGGLVEDQDGGVEVDRPGDGYQLLDGQRVPAEHRVGVDAQVEPGQQRGGALAHRAPVDPPESAWLAAEHDVLRDGEVGAEVHLLVDRRDPGLLGRAGSREHLLLAADPDRARVDAVDPGQRLDQGGLARAVLPHEGVHLAGQQAEVDPVERLDSGKGDRDVAHLHHRLRFAHGSSSLGMRRADTRGRGRHIVPAHLATREPWISTCAPAARPWRRPGRRPSPGSAPASARPGPP